MKDESVWPEVEAKLAKRHLFVMGRTKPSESPQTELQIICRHAQWQSAFQQAGHETGPEAA
jgi:hypothetical protein